jgi:predicted extracellular nuclease
MKKSLLIITILANNLMVLFSQGATDLFFSEYVEGSSSNKYLEVFNGTGTDIDLSDYQLKLYSNGGIAPSYTNDLTGTLATGQVVVYKFSSSTIYAGAAINASACNFNGNDAIVLF